MLSKLNGPTISSALLAAPGAAGAAGAGGTVAGNVGTAAGVEVPGSPGAPGAGGAAAAGLAGGADGLLVTVVLPVVLPRVAGADGRTMMLVRGVTAFVPSFL